VKAACKVNLAASRHLIGYGAPVAPQRVVKLTIEYDGTAYGGWQRQANAPSIQQCLEEALRQMTHEPALRIQGAGRTDAGVHATGQVASFVTATTIPPYGFLRGLATFLPRDIAIVGCEDAPEGFDARHSADAKHYRYRMLSRKPRSALRDRFVWHVPGRPLDAAAMAAACVHLAGRRDFAAFRSADCERQTTVRTLSRVEITPADDEIHLDVVGDAFLKNMVRILTGTLVEVGRGAATPDEIAAIVASGDRTKAGMTAPARGLTLVAVLYPPPGQPLRNAR
jgi:tRNA pseudouridine38-40 synthase